MTLRNEKISRGYCQLVHRESEHPFALARRSLEMSWSDPTRPYAGGGGLLPALLLVVPRRSDSVWRNLAVSAVSVTFQAYTMPNAASKSTRGTSIRTPALTREKSSSSSSFDSLCTSAAIPAATKRIFSGSASACELNAATVTVFISLNLRPFRPNATVKKWFPEQRFVGQLARV